MFEQSISAYSADKISDWVLRGGVALAFVLFGLDKFPSEPGAPWVGFFQQIGIGQWFRYFTGIVEVGGAVLVMIPFTARTGLAILAATMVVASCLHVLVIHQPANVLVTGGLSLLLIALWYKKR
jgi:uncharacterized membrane protein YphA (DoxX/SURF4 family)